MTHLLIVPQCCDGNVVYGAVSYGDGEDDFDLHRSCHLQEPWWTPPLNNRLIKSHRHCLYFHHRTGCKGHAVAQVEGYAVNVNLVRCLDEPKNFLGRVLRR